jgi:lipoprotein
MKFGCLVASAMVAMMLSSCGTDSTQIREDYEASPDDTSLEEETSQIDVGKQDDIDFMTDSAGNDGLYYSFGGELDIKNKERIISIQDNHWISTDYSGGDEIDLTNVSELEPGLAASYWLQYYDGNLYYIKDKRLMKMKYDGSSPVVLKANMSFYDMVIHENGYIYFTGSEINSKEYYMLRMPMSDLIELIDNSQEDETTDVWSVAENLFKIDIDDFNLRLTIVKVTLDNIYYGVEDLESKPLGFYGIYRMNLSTNESDLLFSCCRGTSGTELEIKGLTKEEIGLEYDDGCWVYGDQIVLLCYNRVEDRFVKVIIENDIVSTETTNYSLINTFEELYPEVFGVEFNDRFNKTEIGYYAVL